MKKDEEIYLILSEFRDRMFGVDFRDRKKRMKYVKMVGYLDALLELLDPED